MPSLNFCHLANKFVYTVVWCTGGCKLILPFSLGDLSRVPHPKNFKCSSTIIPSIWPITPPPIKISVDNPGMKIVVWVIFEILISNLVITKTDNVTFVISFWKVISQLNIYCIPNSQFIALRIWFYIHKPSKVFLLYFETYELAISELKITSMVTKWIWN